MRIASPFADAPPAPEPVPVVEVEPPGARLTASPMRPRRELLTLAEGWLPGVGAARLPSIATVRAYHRAGEYVPWDAGLIAWPARVHGWAAVGWVTVCTCAGWAGAGRYPARLRTLWTVGIPGLVRAQLPPLRDLSGVARAWVALWSTAGWLGLKFWRLPVAAAYVLLAVAPFLF